MRTENQAQKSEGGTQNKESKIRNRIIVLCCLLFCGFCLFSCSIPNLEPAECTEARQPLKEFYSVYFGDNQGAVPENLKPYEKYLSTEFFGKLQAAQSATDPFTLTDDPPKAFRIGACQVTEASKKADFQILLFWKTDTRSEQREIYAEAVRENDKWLINKISNNNQ